eukprot:gene3053-5986_t
MDLTVTNSSRTNSWILPPRNSPGVYYTSPLIQPLSSHFEFEGALNEKFEVRGSSSDFFVACTPKIVSMCS